MQNIINPVQNTVKQANFKTHYLLRKVNVPKTLEQINYGPGVTSDSDLVSLASHIQSKIKQIYYQPIEGQITKAIPALSNAQEDLLACAVCTVDGKQFSVGADKRKFTLQSCIKPFLYVLACKNSKHSVVHRRIGREPSGQPQIGVQNKGQVFNSFTLNKDNKPFNPMINAGAITTASLIKPQSSSQDRFDYLMSELQNTVELSDDDIRDIEINLKEKSEKHIKLKVGFDYRAFLSETGCSSRNLSLAHFLNGEGVNEEQLTHEQVEENLNFYHEACNIEGDVNVAAALAATLANQGTSPITGHQLCIEKHAVSVTQLMFSCGMYNYSGNWACRVGLPSKSGISGLVIAIVPNVMGIAFLSPPLDQNGNSKRAIEFYEWLAEEFKFNIFNALVQQNRNDSQAYWRQRVNELCQEVKSGAQTDLI